MTSARSSRAARNRWLPEGRRGPMPWIIGIMMFLTVLSAACALGLGHALTRLRGDLAGGYTIQIVEANAAKRMQAVRGITRAPYSAADMIFRMTSRASSTQQSEYS